MFKNDKLIKKNKINTYLDRNTLMFINQSFATLLVQILTLFIFNKS